MTATYVRELTGFRGEACLVLCGTDYYAVSSVNLAFDTGMSETLVFPANSDGQVTSWGDVAGGSNMSREQAIADLERNLTSQAA